MNEITPSRNGQDQYYNKWERLFKGSSSYQEEQQEALSEQAPAELNPWEKMAQEVLNEQPHTTETAYEKAENVEKGAESEKIEETVPEENLEKLSSGEKTTIYRSENENGEKNVVLESDYFRLARQFRDSHPELKSTDNTEIDLAFMGLSSDLAMIDATHGKNLKNGAENLRESLVDDYSKLRAKFEDPNTPAEDKQLIAEYFETMDGEALSFLKASFSGAEEAKKQEEAEKIAEKKKFEEDLEKIKEKLADAREKLDGDISELDSLIRDFRRDDDVDSMQSKLRQIRETLDGLYESNKNFSNVNSEYEDVVSRGKESEFFDEEQAKGERRQVLDNEDYSHMIANRGIFSAEEEFKKMQIKVTALENERSAHRYNG